MVRDSPDTAPSAARVNDREERPRSTPNLTTSFRGTHVVAYTARRDRKRLEAEE
jgi:hypothetical protein